MAASLEVDGGKGKGRAPHSQVKEKWCGSIVAWLMGPMQQRQLEWLAGCQSRGGCGFSPEGGGRERQHRSSIRSGHWDCRGQKCCCRRSSRLCRWRFWWRQWIRMLIREGLVFSREGALLRLLQVVLLGRDAIDLGNMAALEGSHGVKSCSKGRQVTRGRKVNKGVFTQRTD